jgi:hypothetical protein
MGFDYDNFVERYTAQQNSPGDMELYFDVIDRTGKFWVPITRKWHRRDENPAELDPDLVAWIQLLMQITDRTIEFPYWAFNGDVVFCEWKTSGAYRGRPIEWRGVNRFVLRDEPHPRVIEEAAHFDTGQFWELIDPARGTAPTPELNAES